MVTLKNVLRANATNCIIFGLMFLLMPSTIARFLSTDRLAPNFVLSIIGAGLIINGLHLVWAFLKPIPAMPLILYFASGDFLWVLATMILIVVGLWITTSKGIITALLVSAVVGILGVFQIIMRKKMGNT